jgi:hypothetical protein
LVREIHEDREYGEARVSYLFKATGTGEFGEPIVAFQRAPDRDVAKRFLVKRFGQAARRWRLGKASWQEFEDQVLSNCGPEVSKGLTAALVNTYEPIVVEEAQGIRFMESSDFSPGSYSRGLPRRFLVLD